MRTATKDEFAKMMATLRSSYPNAGKMDSSWTELVRSYYLDLQKYPVGALLSAFNRTKQESLDFFPSAGRLAVAAKEESKRLQDEATRREERLEQLNRARQDRLLKAAKVEEEKHVHPDFAKLARLWEEQDQREGWADANPMPKSMGMKRLNQLNELIGIRFK